MNPRKLFAECLGTALLVYFAVGVATLSFGKFSHGVSIAGTSLSAGVIATALAFGLVMLALAYAIGPISGAHINPAVTMGFLASKRMSIQDAVGYWVAQFVGATIGAFLLWATLKQSPLYTSHTGLGADGWGKNSMRRRVPGMMAATVSVRSIRRWPELPHRHVRSNAASRRRSPALRTQAVAGAGDSASCSRTRCTPAAMAPPTSGATMNSQSWAIASPPAKSAGPKLRAGFTDVPVSGTPMR